MLLLETLIYKNMVLGYKWEEAQKILMETVVDKGGKEAIKVNVQNDTSKGPTKEESKSMVASEPRRIKEKIYLSWKGV